MADYEFTTIWRVQAPQEKVWHLIFHSDRWPNWWRGVEKVEKLRDGRRESRGRHLPLYLEDETNSSAALRAMISRVLPL